MRRGGPVILSKALNIGRWIELNFNPPGERLQASDVQFASPEIQFTDATPFSRYGPIFRNLSYRWFSKSAVGNF